jgi:hypothetical protein
MKIRKKIGNRTLVITIPSLFDNGGESAIAEEVFFSITWLLTEDGNLRLTEDGFERVLE